MTSALTQLRRSISATDTEIKVISLAAFRPDADKQIGEEFVRCASFTTDASGWPVLSGCQRGVAQEDGGSAPRPWPGGTPVFEVGWTADDTYGELPAPSSHYLGRKVTAQWSAEQPSATFVGDIAEDGTPFWRRTSGDDKVQLSKDPNIATPISVDGIAASDRSLWVSEPISGVVKRLSFEGALLATYGPSATLADEPMSLAHDDTNNRIGVAGTDAGTQNGFQVWDEAFSSRVFQVSAAGAGDGQFNEARGLAADASGNWYVTDVGNNRVQKFSAAGVFQAKWGAFGSGNGQFNVPWGICVDGDGNVHVADNGNARIQKFTPAGAFLKSYGGRGFALGQLQGPTGLAHNAELDLIFAADFDQRMVHVFDANGVFVTRVGGGADLDVANPYNLAARGNRLWMVDALQSFIHSWKLLSGDDPRGIATVVTFFAHSLAAANGIWTNMPAALTSFMGLNLHRTILDTSQASEFRLAVCMGTAGSAGAELRLEYWTGSAWADAASTGGGGDVSIAATGTTAGPWAAFAAGAIGPSVELRLAGLDGNGVADPNFGFVTMEYR